MFVKDYFNDPLIVYQNIIKTKKIIWPFVQYAIKKFGIITTFRK